MLFLGEERRRIEEVKALLLDGGYIGKPFADFVGDHLGATVGAAKRNEFHTCAVIPKRRVVERNIS